MARKLPRAIVLTGAVAAIALALPLSAPADAAGSAKKYPNCTALNRVYPHGVGKTGARDHVSSGTPVTTFTRNNAVYGANTARDRDKDNIACEKK